MKANIALIGFMGSGKSTIGRQLARALEMKFVDIDRVIESMEGITIPEIFKEKGEAYFRKLESDTIKKEASENNVIISTGGGVIIDNQNIRNLKQSSYVVYLDCTLDCIYKRVKRRKNRPLLNVEDMYQMIKDLLEKRETLYRISCDYNIKIDEHSSVYDTVQTIKNKYIQG